MPAAGWYPDPYGSGRWLWWDGRQWVLPTAAAAPQPATRSRRWPARRWAVLGGVGAVCLASWIVVASGVVGGIYFEADPASLFESYATEPLRSFGWPAALLTTVAVVAVLWQGRRRWVLFSTSAVSALSVGLLVTGVVLWQGRAHPQAGYATALKSLSMPAGFTDQGIRDTTLPDIGPPEVERTWTTSLPVATACTAAAAAIQPWADAGSLRKYGSSLGERVTYCQIFATRHGDSVSVNISPVTASPVPSTQPPTQEPYRVVVTVGPSTGT
jgi:hypothetical protein